MIFVVVFAMEQKIPFLSILITTCLLVFSFTTGLSAKSVDRLTGVEGTVLNASGNAIPGATISVYDEAEELVTGATTSPDGEFMVELDPGTYRVIISYVSFRTFEDVVELDDGELVELGNIRLEEERQQLDEVVVESQAAAVEMRFDRRIYRADAEVEAMGGSALDLLETIPSVESDIDGNISLRGSENVRVLINGRPSALLSGGTEALASIPSESIERVEVITNPSARYSAEGDAGVINIVLKRNRTAGLNGSVAARTGIPGDHRLSTNLNTMANRANYFTNIGVRYRDRPSETNRFQQFQSPDTSYMYTQNQDRIRRELRGDVRLGAEVFVSERQTITPSAFFRLRTRDNSTDTFYRDMDLSGNLLREIFREDLEDEDRTNLEFDLDYRFDIGGSSDQELMANFKIDYQPETEMSDLREFNELTGQDLARQRTDNREEITNILMQIDYNRLLGDRAEMELGGRSTYRWVDNQYRVEERVDGEWQPFEGFNDDFNYTRNINAAYAILSTQFGPVSLQGGLRLEQSRIETELTESGERNTQNYLDLFPSLFANYEFNDQNSIQASYSRRLSRPRFRNILPFSNFRDSRDIFIGNPELEPVYSNSYELSYLRLWESGSISTSVYHRYRTGVVERITELDGVGVTQRFPVNLSTQSNWGTELALSQRLFGLVNMRVSANYFFSETDGTYLGEVFERSTEAFFGRMRFQMELFDGFNLQSTYFYSGPRSTTQGRQTASHGMNLTLSRQFFDGDATLSLSGRDLFNTRGRTNIVEEPNFYSERERRWRSRSVRVNLIWRFNTLSG